MEQYKAYCQCLRSAKCGNNLKLDDARFRGQSRHYSDGAKESAISQKRTFFLLGSLGQIFGQTGDRFVVNWKMGQGGQQP
jgi:hypothetical protein